MEKVIMEIQCIAVAVPYQNTPGTSKLAYGTNANTIEITATNRAIIEALQATVKLSTAAEANRQKIRGYRYFNITRIPYSADGAQKSPIINQTRYMA